MGEWKKWDDMENSKWVISSIEQDGRLKMENLISNGATREADWLAERSLDTWNEKCDVPVKPHGEKSSSVCG